MWNKLFALFGLAPIEPTSPVINKRIAFIDGDQPIEGILSAYNRYVANTNTETHVVRKTVNVTPVQITMPSTFKAPMVYSYYTPLLGG